MFRKSMLLMSFLLFSATPVMGQGIDIIAKGTFTIAAGEADSTRVDLRNIVADFTKSVHVTGDTLGGIAVARAIVIDTVGALTISTFYDTAGQAWFGGGDSILINFYKADYLDGSYRLDATPTPIRNTSTVGLQFSTFYKGPDLTRYLYIRAENTGGSSSTQNVFWRITARKD